jgi:hypothetical protein
MVMIAPFSNPLECVSKELMATESDHYKTAFDNQQQSHSPSDFSHLPLAHIIPRHERD